MTINEIITAYINFLWKVFQFDMDMYTKWWMWVFIAVPAVLYTVFFFAKWAVMTAPVWLPVFLALTGFKNVIKGGKKTAQPDK
jgi:hypothetical protein